MKTLKPSPKRAGFHRPAATQGGISSRVEPDARPPWLSPGLAYPEIVDMQTRAILEAAVTVAKSGLAVNPEIMVPLVMEPVELKTLRAQIEGLAESVFEELGACVSYTVGTMIELPRACLWPTKSRNTHNSSASEPTTLPKPPWAYLEMTRGAS